MAKKIKNLRLSTTEKKENDGWGEVKSYRNKHLINSDWTQTADAGLTEANIKRWADWRRELRRINRRNYASKELALNSLSDLSRMEPSVEYVDETVLLNATYADYNTESIIAAKRKGLSLELNKKFNRLLEKKRDSFLLHDVIVDEQYEEAILYRSDMQVPRNIHDYPLIKLEMELKDFSSEDAVQSFLVAKRSKLRLVISLKRKFSFFLNAINSATNMVQLDNIQRELHEWTLILT